MKQKDLFITSESPKQHSKKTIVLTEELSLALFTVVVDVVKSKRPVRRRSGRGTVMFSDSPYGP